MSRRALAWIAIVALAVGVVQENAPAAPELSIGRRSIREEATAPTDTTVAWIRLADHQTYMWRSFAQVWASPYVPNDLWGFANGSSGLQRYGQTNTADTSIVATAGLWTADSLYLDRVIYFAKRSLGVANACTLRVWTTEYNNATSLLYEVVIPSGAAAFDTVGVNKFTPDSCRISVDIQVASGSTLGSNSAYLELYKFVRPS